MKCREVYVYPALSVDADVGRVGTALGSVLHFIAQQVVRVTRRHFTEQLAPVVHVN